MESNDGSNRVWKRTCKRCKKTIEHKSKARWRDAVKKDKLCSQCNRSTVGKKNSLGDSCPLCSANIRIPIVNTAELTKHAEEHGTTPEKLWLAKHGIAAAPTCRCGCGNPTKWNGWWRGFSEFKNGHNGSIYSSYDKEAALEIAKKRSSSLAGKPGWSKGLTKETDARIKARSNGGSIAHKFTDFHIRERLAKNERLVLKDIIDYKNCTSESILVSCNRCNTEHLTSYVKARTDRCGICDPLGRNLQIEISDWIESLIGFDVGKNVKGIIGRNELDIYVPSHKFAIETSGVWSSADKKLRDRFYHQKKTDSCKRIGIQLFHVFEDEWYSRQEIVKSMIAARLDMINTRIMARKCKTTELSPRTRREFFNANHIDGDVQSHKAWGLEYDNKIVAAVSIRHPFHKKNNDAFEIARFCNLRNSIVTGAAGKLTNVVAEYAKNTSKTRLISYVDERFGGDGRAYEQSGFMLVGTTPPRFWWTDGKNRFNRFQVRADHARKLSETQVAEELGVIKIYGCKNFKYELEL